MRPTELIVVNDQGVPTDAFVPVIPEGASSVVKEGLARRRLVATTLACPCGADVYMPNRQQRRAATKAGRVLRMQVAHEDDCPAISPAVKRWQQ